MPNGRGHRSNTIFTPMTSSVIPANLQSQFDDLDDELISPVQLLFSDSLDDRLVGVVNLQYLCDEQTVPFLVAALADTSQEVVLTAVTSLWEIANQSAVEPLMSCLSSAYSLKVRKEALAALKELVNQDHLLALLDRLSIDDDLLQNSILILLRKIHDIQALPYIAPFLESEIEHLRLASITTLRYLNQLTHFPPALSLASDQSVEVRKEAMLTFAHLEEPEVLPILIKSLLDDSSWEVRRNAARALEQKSDPASAGALASAISDQHWQVRKFALRALNPLVADQFVPNIIPLLCDDYSDVRKEAALALGGVVSERAKTALQQSLSDADIEVRIASEKSLSRQTA